MRVLLVVVSLVTLGWVPAAEFNLKDADGKLHGPFEFREGASIRLGKNEWTVSSVSTDIDALSNKLSRIQIPSMEIKEATLEEALKEIRAAAAANDPEKKGINLVLDYWGYPGGIPEDPVARQEKLNELKGQIPKVSLEARNASLLELLNITAMVANMRVRMAGNIVTVCPLDSPDGPIVVRKYNTMASFMEVTGRIPMRDYSGVGASTDPYSAAATHDLKSLFAEMGVKWPMGSSIQFVPSIGKLIVANTESNLRLFERLLNMLNVTPNQIETELQFVSFDRQDIGKLSPYGITAAALFGLWTNGHGELIASPRSITQAGQETTFGGGIRHANPTSVAVQPPVATNATGGTDPAQLFIPGGLSSVTAGVSVAIMAQVTPEGSLLILNVSAELTEEPVWRECPVVHVDSGGNETKVPLVQPSCPVYPLVTQVAVYNGSTILIGGGMPLRGGQRVVYVFLTCRLVDPDGKPLPRDDAW